MATRFSPLLRDAYAAIHDTFGEEFRHRPMARPADARAAPSADPGRLVAIVTGIFSDAASRLDRSDAYDQRTDQRPGAVGGSPTIEVNAGIETGVDIRRGDQLERIADGKRWRVVEARRDAEGIVMCDVSLI